MFLCGNICGASGESGRRTDRITYVDDPGVHTRYCSGVSDRGGLGVDTDNRCCIESSGGRWSDPGTLSIYCSGGSGDGGLSNKLCLVFL